MIKLIGRSKLDPYFLQIIFFFFFFFFFSDLFFFFFYLFIFSIFFFFISGVYRPMPPPQDMGILR